MKPVLLVMNAFGPFAKRQEIDFGGLGKAKLFLVTGETGAGKTTIFDAISFALYGNASGENRKPNTLKSHHAAPEEPCWVQLIFRIRDEEYTVYRSPAQTGAKRDGSPKGIGEKAEINLPDGETVTGAKNVDRYIEELIGLRHDQFKQTTMLAQGEFRRFLEANSTDKQQIFSKIFSTGEYSRITAWLSERESMLQARARAAQEAKVRVLGELASMGHTELRDSAHMSYQLIADIAINVTESYEDKLAQAADDIRDAEKEKAAIDINSARQINEKILRYNEAVEKYDRLSGLSGEVDAKRSLVRRIRDANSLKQWDEIVLSIKNGMNEIEKRLAATGPEFAECVKKLTASEQEYGRVPEYRQKALEMRERADQLMLKKLEAEKYGKAVADLEKCEKGIKEAKAEIEALGNALERMKISQSMKAYQDAEKLADKIKAARLEAEKLRGEQIDAAKAAEEAYNAMIRGQATVIAMSLEDGLPCPVCGSTHHPIPADETREVPGEEHVGKLRGIETELAVKIKESVNSTEALYDRLFEILPELSGYKGESTSVLADVITGGLLECENKLDELPTADSRFADMDPVQIERSIGLWNGRLLSSTEELPTLRKAAEAVSGGDASAIQAELEAVLVEEKAYSMKTDDAQNEYVRTRSAYDRLSAQTEADTRNLEAQKGQFLRQEQAFTDSLAEVGFSNYEDYKSVLKEATSFEQLNKHILSYEKELAEITAFRDTLEREVRGKSISDIASMSEKLSEIDVRLSMLRKTEQELSAWLMFSGGKLAELKRIGDEQEGLDAEFAIAHELAVLAKGNKPPYISFERYILAAYFEDILQVANIHLQRMTKLRYKLKRREEASGRTAGLDMDIMDSYTGQERSVSTLSGGEGFQASLALALGLSDVVQMYAGGVTIDTMFIDEGFGSLDEKALDGVVETLVSLEQIGRTVGIISHVQILQSYISAKLLVKRSGTGSTAEFVVG